MADGEFEIIRRYFDRPSTDPDVLLGIGDDAALVAATGTLAIAVDTLVAGVHFPVALGADAIGYRSLAVNLSDMAAMAAVPRWFTLALTIPDADARWLESFSAGLFDLAERNDVTLIGGDLTRGPLTVSVQIVGSVGAAGALTRAGGHPGDDVYVTGTLGDSAAGLALLEDAGGAASAARRALEQRFVHPTPRVTVGCALGGLASAAIDVSDGLLADLGHLCAASGCGAIIDTERLPISGELLSLFPPAVAEAYALGGGDDYELCFTAAPSQAQSIEAALEAVGGTAHRIGRLVDGAGVDCRRDGQTIDPPGLGYTHF